MRLKSILAHLAMFVSVNLLIMFSIPTGADAYNIEISQLSFTSLYSAPIGNSVGQSFTAPYSGLVTHIGLATNGATVSLSILEGDGESGAVLYSESDVFFRNTATNNPVSHTLRTPLRVVGGQSYTIKVTNTSEPEWGSRFFSSDLDGDYDGGRRYTFGGPDDSPAADLSFRVRIQTEIEVLGEGSLIESASTAISAENGTDLGSSYEGRPVTQTFSLRNRTRETVNIGSISLEGGNIFTAEPTSFTLGPLATTTFSVTMDATGAAEGVHSDTVQIFWAGDPVPYTFDIRGEKLPTPAEPFTDITGPSGPVDGAFEATVTFSETVTGFGVDDLNLSGIFGNFEIDRFVDNDDGTFTISVIPSGDGVLTFHVPADVATDAQGDGNLESNEFTVRVDLPNTYTPTITGPSQTSVGAFDVAVDFGQVVNGFALDDVSVLFGTAIEFIDLGAGLYVVTIVPSQTFVLVSVGGNAVTSLDGFQNSPSQSTNISAIPDPPRATLSGPTTTQIGPFTVAVDFAVPVSDFTLDDIALVNATASELTSRDNDQYFTALITPTMEGLVTVRIQAGVANDIAGNGNHASNPLVVLADWSGPAPVITASAFVPAVFDATIDFGEVIRGFEITDIVVTNGTPSNLVDLGDGAYTVTITTQGEGAVTVDVADAAGLDIQGYPTEVPEPLAVTSDHTNSSPVLTAPPLTNGLFEVVVDFGEPVTLQSESFVTATNATISNVSDQGEGRFVLALTPESDGEITIDLAANVALDSAGNNNNAATGLVVLADLTRPVPVITGPIEDQVGPFSISIAFGEPVSGLEVEDFVVHNGALSSLVDLGNGNYSAIVTWDSPGGVTVRVRGAGTDDLAGNVNLISAPYAVLAGFCGDGVKNSGEECDDIGESATCDADCTFISCGDGYINRTSEFCDESEETATCDRDCSESICGDGLVNSISETCDDGNDEDADGCAADCTVEVNWTCVGETLSSCSPLEYCGDSSLDEGEACDDGNNEAGDGCDATCATEVGWVCNLAQPSVCSLDTDEDGVSDSIDNCPEISNDDQADSDQDGVGDACDEPDVEDVGMEDVGMEDVGMEDVGADADDAGADADDVGADADDVGADADDVGADADDVGADADDVGADADDIGSSDTSSDVGDLDTGVLDTGTNGEDAPEEDASDDSGCGCSIPSRPQPQTPVWCIVLGVVGLVVRRRRR